MGSSLDANERGVLYWALVARCVGCRAVLERRLHQGVMELPKGSSCEAAKKL